MPHLRLSAACLVVACLAGCGKGKPAPEPAEAIDARDPLYAVAVGRPMETLYGTRGDVLVARKANGHYYLESVPCTEDFSFQPGQFAPADAAEAAKVRQFRIRELTAQEWDGLRKIVTEQKLFERKPVAASTRGLQKQVLVCGAKSVLLGWARGGAYDRQADDLSRLLHDYATVGGRPWIAPDEPLPADAVDKILLISVGEAQLGLGGGSAWRLEASRDKQGALITMYAGEEAIELPDDLAREHEIHNPPRSFRLTDDEWKALLEFIRKQDLLHWKPPDIRANDGGDSFVTIRTVVDFRHHWSLGLNQDPKAVALAAELKKLFELKAK